MATVNKDFRVKHGLVVEGTNATVDGSDIITEAAITGGTQTNISVTYNPSTKLLDFVAENGVEDSTTDDLEEGEDNLYFTDQRAIDAVGGSATPDNEPNTVVKRDANGDFAAGIVTAKVKTSTEPTYDYEVLSNNEFGAPVVRAHSYKVQDSSVIEVINGPTGQEVTVKADRLVGGSNTILGPTSPTIMDDVYLYSEGADNKVATMGDIDDHSDLTTGVHGVSGDVVGTTDTQDISNKRIVDTLYFTDGVTIADEGQIAVLAGSHDFEIKANYGDLTLKTMAADADVVISSDSGDIVLNADGSSYITSVSAGNKIATHAYVDNAIAGLSWKDSVNLFATSNVPLTGNTETVIIDGHAALDGTDDGYRLLLTNQTTDTENGIYVYADNGTTYTLTRSEDADTVAELIGAAVFVKEGTQYGATSWVQANHYATTFDGLTWTQFSGSGSVTAGEGITVDGLEIAVDRTTVDTWYDAAGTAQGIVDELDTDDIEEGETNLYFTDTRAVTALEAVVPNFTAVEVNSVAKQVAATVVPATGETVAYAFVKSDYRSAKFMVKVAFGTHTEVSEVLLTLDTSDNIAITEYALVGTNGTMSTVSAGVNGSNVELLVTPTNAQSTITVVGTLLA
jgi:hypothetical protein